MIIVYLEIQLISRISFFKFQEISLRTNNIEWVREFLSPQCNGLDTLIEYLTTRLCLMRHKLEVEKENNSNANTTDDWTVHSK